jgi:hypothetical protein
MAEQLNFEKVVKCLQTTFAGKNLRYFLPESLGTPLEIRMAWRLHPENDIDVIISALREWKERVGPTSNFGMLKKEILQSFKSCEEIAGIYSKYI